MTRRGRLLVALGLVVVLGAATAVGGVALDRWLRGAPIVPADGCVITALGRTVDLEPEQTANAAVIAAVGSSRGLPPHAVTVALAAALQESKLRNLPYGDRDSLGLFQQRPSQGWGTPRQISDPRYAAARFYAHLVAVRGWQDLPVADAAQKVQRSADGSAYAGWEPQARSLAQALTGHAGAAVACTVRHFAATPSGLAAGLLADFGGHALDRPVADPVRGWALAGWLVAHARAYRLAKVSYLGHSWSAATGRWAAGGVADPQVRFVVEPAPTPK